MAHRRLRSRLAPRWGSASLAAVLSLSACSAGSSDPASITANPGASASATASDPLSSATSTYSAAACHSKQRRTVAALEWPILQEVWRVMASPPEGSAPAAQRLRTRVETLETEVAASCGGESREMAAFAGVVRAATESELDDSGTRRVLDAYAQWASAVEARDNLEGVADDLAFCDDFEDDVRAGYAVRSEPAPYGKRSWVELIVDNDTSTRYWFELGGELWATGLRPDLARGHPRDDRGGRQWVWGGSSADTMYADPGVRTTHPVGVGELQYLYMRPAGEVYAVRPDVVVRAEGHTCSLPVVRVD